MQRPDRCFQAEPDNDERKARLNTAIARQRRQHFGNLSDVQRTRGGIEEAHTNNVEAGAERTHDEVVERGRKSAAIPARPQRDQHIGGNRRNFEEDEEVERISRDRNAAEARKADEKGGVEQRVLALRDLCLDRRP